MSDRPYPDLAGLAHFITFSCYRRQPFLLDEKICHLFVVTLDELRGTHGFKVLAYVLMPEHVHLVIHPKDHTEVGVMIGKLKATVTRKVSASLGNRQAKSSRTVLWYKRCYDHQCLTVESVREKIEYCHKNPVKRGLVAELGDWKWSSYNWYAGKRDVPIEIDSFES